MASRSTRPNGHTWIFVKAANGKRRTIRLGNLSPDDADEAQRRLTRIEQAYHSGQSLDALTSVWLDALPKANQDRVFATGLVAADPGKPADRNADFGLSKLIDEWKGTLDVEPDTLRGYEQHAEFLRRYFGDNRDVTRVLPADADKFRIWALESGRVNGKKPLSRSTVSRAIRTWQAIFEFACRLKWRPDNPFRHLRAQGEFNPARNWYITRDLVDLLIVEAGEPELAAMIALSRYATFRGPSEFSQLRWSDVDLPGGTVRITAPKTKRYEHGARRSAPLEGRAHEQLERLWDAAPDGADLVLPKLGAAESSRLSQRVGSICRRLGVPFWPKPWINMRASCETDWQTEGRSIFETAEWMGHSPEVALRHYRRIAKDQVVDLPATHRKTTRSEARSPKPSDPKHNPKHEYGSPADK
ncbi:MAG: hypothetical protein AAGJ46_20950 [Planctomycetota bacterium]